MSRPALRGPEYLSIERLVNEMTDNFKTCSGKIITLARPHDQDSAGQYLARCVAGRIRDAASKGLTICFPTGSTPVPAYQKLVAMHREHGLSFKHVRAFHLDEYIGLPDGHPSSYKSVLKDNLFDHVDLHAGQANFYDFSFDNPEKTAADYEMRIKEAGGIDLMILGIGANGHIAFNEPGSRRDSRTRVVKLTEETLARNAQFFDDPSQEPHLAISQGIANILEARSIIMMATGKDKAEAVRKALFDPVSPQSPASYLQEFGGDLTFVVDDGAATLFPNA